ncbi:MAG TPA: GntR family transcriptional regulator [Thermodesulfobacteriota bacterium]
MDVNRISRKPDASTLAITDRGYRSAQTLVYDTLRRAIVTHRLAPGAALKAVDLAASLGVSPTPVREALIRLHADGLVVYRPNRGAVVAPLAADEVRHLYDMRGALEGLAAARAAERADADALERIGTLVEAMSRHLAEGRLAEVIAMNRDFHRAIHLASGNPVLADALEGLLDRTARFRMLYRDLPERVEQAHREHVALLDALRRRDAAEAEQLMRRNILEGSHAVVDHIARLAPEQRGETPPGRRRS